MSTASHTVERNEACPCGSGKKYKKCCLGVPDPRAVRRSRIERTLAVVLLLVTAVAFLALGRTGGAMVGLAGFGALVAYHLAAPSPPAERRR